MSIEEEFKKVLDRISIDLDHYSSMLGQFYDHPEVDELLDDVSSSLINLEGYLEEQIGG